MSKYNLFVELAVAGDVSELKDTFDYLVRDAIESRVEGMRPEVHAAIFGSKTVESFSESVEKYHIKFKDKSGQWFKSRSFKSQNEMNQHFWSKIKPASTEVQFHGPKGRIAEDVNLLEATEADVAAIFTEDTVTDADYVISEGSTPEDLQEKYSSDTNDSGHHILSHNGSKFSVVKPRKNGTYAGFYGSKQVFNHGNFREVQKHLINLHKNKSKNEDVEIDYTVTEDTNTPVELEEKFTTGKNAKGYTIVKHDGTQIGAVRKEGDSYGIYHQVGDKSKNLGVHQNHDGAVKVLIRKHKKLVGMHENFGKFNRSAITIAESAPAKFVYEHVVTEGFHDMSPEAHELVLHADNTEHLHKAQSAYVKNMAGHMKKGKYASDKGKKLWGYYADHVAKDYHKEHGDKYSKWHHVFPKKARDEVAAHFEHQHRETAENHLKGIKEDVNMFSENAHSGQVLSESFHDMSHAARELVLHSDNTHHLYQAQAGYVNNMKTHMRRGNYSHEKGKKLWGYYADHAAKDYHKTYGDKHTPWHKAFTKKDREQVAHHFESHHRDELKHSGEVH